MFAFRLPRGARAAAVIVALLGAASASFAAEHRFSILLDTDNSAATGCAVTTSVGPTTGVERIISAVVATTTTGATIARLEEERCTGSTVSAPTVYDSGGWNVGLTNGLNGKAVVEFSVPLATLPVAGTMKALAVSRNSAGQPDATSAFLIGLLAAVTPPPDAVPVPQASGLAMLLAVLIAVALSRVLKSGGAARIPLIVVVALLCSALAWAATVNRDGSTGDWLGVSPAVTDPVGDAPPNADIVAVFYQQDTSNLFFRIDADIQLDAPVNQAPVVNAGPNQSITLPATATLAGSATDDGLPNPPAALTYAWSVVSGPSTSVTFANASAAATTATFPAAGVYVLRLTASDSLLSGSATVQITVGTVAPINQAPVVNAGPTQTITLPATATLAGSATDDGLPNPPAALTYTWSVVSGPVAGVTFSNASAVATTATFPAAGAYLLRLTASDSLLSGSATVQISVGTVAPVNQAPVVNAGPNQTITLPATASLSGTATDDGLPNPPAGLTYIWSVVSGPSTAVTFANATARATTATFPAAGIYVLRLTASDSLLSGSATVQITVGPVAPVNQAPVVNAGANQTITLPATATLSGSATDDGLPNPPGALTYAWSFVSGPSTAVTFFNANAATTLANFPTAGTYVLRLTANDSLLTGNSTVQITVQAAAIVNQAPVVNAGSNQTITLPATAALSGSATDDGLPNPPGAITLNWSMVSGPASVIFANPNAAATGATFAAPGTYVLRLTANDSALSGSSTVQITVIDGAPTLAAIPDRTISLGARFQQLLVASDGNVNDTLSYALSAAPSGAALAPAPLIDWTPTSAQLGTHTFTANVTDTAGHTASVTFRVTVVHTNQPPVLATQLSVILPIGTPFSRTLTAIDPDLGDTLTFTLVSGPPGMTLTGAVLNWSTTGRTAGDYAVTVRVTDAAGLSDTRQFTVTLQPASTATPVAVDDAYAVRLGQTLTVPASGVVGVLGNDSSPSGNALSAVKLTNPDKGTLTAFNPNGGFTYQAPPVLPGSPFVPVLRSHKDLPVPGYTGTAPIMIDLDGDGKPELVIYQPNHRIVAYHADSGDVLWLFDGSFFTGCSPYSGIAEFRIVAGDIDDDGKPEVLFTASCAGDNGPERVVALNGQNGTVKWISALLPAVPVIGDSIGLAERPAPTIARLRPGESPSVLLAAELSGAHRTAIVGFDTFYEPACRAIVETVPDGTYQPLPSLVPLPPHYAHCTGVIVLNGADGTIRHRMIAERPYPLFRDGSREGHGDLHTIVVDLDGDGVPEIVTNGAVFNLDGSVRWIGAPTTVYDIAVGNFDDTPDVEVVRNERTLVDFIAVGSIAVYKQNGTLLWRLPFDDTTFGSKITVGDLDGDGKADILHSEGGLLCAINHLGVYRWCNYMVVGGVSQINSQARYAIFDFDGDGVPEVVVQTTQAILFLDGATGKVKTTFPISKATTGSTREPPATQGTTYHAAAPLVGDVDADGHADLMFFWTGDDPTFSGFGAQLTVLKSQNNDWRPARTVQNQFAYYPANINDNGTIPALPLVNSFALPRTNVFGTQAQVLPPVDPRARAQTSFTYKATDGTLDSQPAKVTIDIAPANRPPKFDSTPPTRYVRNGTFTYTAHATDPDVGDTVTYSLYSETGSGGTCTIVAATGVLSCNTIQAANKVFVIAATDSQGDRSLQTLVMTGVSTSSTVPNVIGQTQTVAATTLTAAGLTTGVVTQLSNPAPVGQVISQAPSAGTSILTGEAVAITVSTGPVPVIVPFVVGETLTLANAQLTTLGFTVAVTPQFSSTIPVNQVMAQSPVAGTALVPIPANPVTVTTSAGPPLAGVITQIIVEPGTTTRLVGENQQYKATAIFSDNTSADVTLASTWSSTASGVATVNAVGLARAVANGATTLQATVGAISGQTTLNVVARVAGDSVLPVALITAPAAGGSITGPTTVTGTATDANFLRYELAVALATDTVYTLIAEGTAPVSGGPLGTLDPTTLLNDLYTLRLTVFDRAGNQTVATSTVQVSGNMKIGLFTLGFQDLNIPLAGIPITVTRTYDSRDKGKGDFGIGWRLGLQTLRLRANRVPGTGWVRSTAGAVVSLAPTSEHKVSLTLGDGRVEEFDMVVSPTSNLGSLNATNVTGYVARPGTLGKLQVLGNTSLLILNGGLEDELVDDITLNTYNPQLFRYTTLEGTQIEIDRGEGVKKITDSNGNSLTFGANGIIHSTGRSVTFTRDLQNRITQITDPLGNVQSYIYDGNGDLISHTNAMGNVSRYKYNRNHGLIDIQDPTGNRAARNDYDANGRLISTTDANGNQITFTHNVGAQEELITDRRGNISRMLYDARGNVLSSEKGVTINGVLVNAVTTTTYDAQNNETSNIDADGLRNTSTYNGVLPLTQVVDPAGLNLTTALVYNAQKDPTTVTDPGGRAFSFAYDGNRNITNVSTPAQGAVASVANAQGLVVQTQDAMGNTTAMTRDAAGRVSRTEVFSATSTLLRRVDFAYDASGNKTSETLYRTIGGVLTPLTTQYAYDAANQLVAVTNPLGGVSRVEYDGNGRIKAEIDPLARRKTYAYDALGRPTQTTMPDGSVEKLTYDVNGNLATSTDAGGRTTSFSYDEINRPVRVTLPGGSFTQTIYSAGGRVTATIDALGNRIDYAYDAAGRRTSTTMPPVVNGLAGPLVRPQRTTLLNTLGAPVSATDPNGRTTVFAYDANGRPTRTTYPDGSTIQQTLDALGRRTGVTNEEGQTTAFGYDGLGRLVSVTGLAGNATYAYDEASNLMTQTDALGRVTRFDFDALNRIVRRQYPSGATEQFAYDAVGNMVTHVDGLGRSTTFDYDAMNRLTSKVLPGGATVVYSYAADGQRASLTDPRGVTIYGYDSIGRLSSVTQPTGETLNYTRDDNGNLLSLASPAATVSYSYDAIGRLIQVNAPEGASRSFYDLAGNRVRQSAANGVVTDAIFDNRDRPTQLSHKTVGGSLLRSYATAFLATGRRSQTTELDGSVEAYAYDTNGRLATESRTGTNPRIISHTYDAVGNRVQRMAGATPTTFSYDSDDRLLSDGTAAYAWDANGNMVSKTQGATVTQYGYDAEDRLVSILGGGLANQYTYDAEGNRVRASSATGTTRFLVDTANATGLSQVLEEKDGSGALQARYSYGNELLAMTRGGNTSFQIHDSFGSTRALADVAGTITDGYQYDAYGNAVDATGGTGNPYRYRGERLDTDSGLYQLRARYYSPVLGRFVARDPFDGEPASPASRHRYLYGNADPVNHIDPSGLFGLSDLSLSSFLGNTIDVAETLGKVRAACKAITTLDQVNELLFFGTIASQVALAVPAIIFNPLDFNDTKEKVKFGSAVYGEIPLFDARRPAGRTGTIERLQLSLLGAQGKIGAKGTLGFSQLPSIEFLVTAPPWDLKVSAVLRGSRYLIKEFTDCGIPVAKIELEPSFKTYSYFGAGGTGVGVAGSIDFKLALFNGHFTATVPLFGLDASGKGFSINLLGIAAKVR